MHIYSTGASEVWKTQTNQIEVTDIKTKDKATMQKKKKKNTHLVGCV